MKVQTYAECEKGDESDGMRAESPVELAGGAFEVGHAGWVGVCSA